MFVQINPFTDDHTERICITRQFIDFLWINTGTQCPYQCPQCHLQSSPHNKSLSFMSVDDIALYLDQYATIPCSQGIRTIGFTGGEPFMNPHFINILHSVLFHNADFHVLILTTATQTLINKWEQLETLLRLHGERITIRVSIDHPTQEKHVRNRHNANYEGNEPAIWEPMLQGLSLLAKTSCTLGITGLPWQDEDPQILQEKYRELCETLKIEIPEKEIIIFPDKVTNFDQNERQDLIQDGITQNCLNIFSKETMDLMCSDSMMLVKPHDGNGRIGIAPCTIIPYNKSYCVFDHSLREVMEERMPLAHANCLWCLSGGNCSGSCDT